MKKKTDARANAPSPPLELSSSNPSPILLFSPHVSPKKTPLSLDLSRISEVSILSRSAYFFAR
jgi:hypothetical protein